MKSILAFGDSLTWGFEAGTFKRHAFEDRWPNALAAGLNGKARVIEEGLNGRTTTYPDHTVTVERNGAVALPMLLTTHQPLDLVIIMLGTNDLKYVNRCRAFDAAQGLKISLVSPNAVNSLKAMRCRRYSSSRRRHLFRLRMNFLTTCGVMQGRNRCCCPPTMRGLPKKQIRTSLKQAMLRPAIQRMADT